MPPSKIIYTVPPDGPNLGVSEGTVEIDFIWRTTSSGNKLTAFKASTLLKDNSDIEKCLFVVDRKDLDRQRREKCSSRHKTTSTWAARRGSARISNQFNRFQEGYVEVNTNTVALARCLPYNDDLGKVKIRTAPGEIRPLLVRTYCHNNNNSFRSLKRRGRIPCGSTTLRA